MVSTADAEIIIQTGSLNSFVEERAAIQGIADEVQTNTAVAENAAAEAESYANAAQLSSEIAAIASPLYATELEGRQASADGEFFVVLGESGNSAVDIHQRIDADTVTVSLKTFPSLAAVQQALNEATQAGASALALIAQIIQAGASINGRAFPAATRMIMSAITGMVVGDSCNLSEGLPAVKGRMGTFYWSGAVNLSALVTADPQQGLVVPPASDPTGATGAWVRDITGNRLATYHFGFVDSDTTDNFTAIQAFWNLVIGQKLPANCTGSGGIASGPVVIGPSSVPSGFVSTTVYDVVGRLRLKAMTGMTTMVKIQNMYRTEIANAIYVAGIGTTSSWASRTVGCGIHITNCGNAVYPNYMRGNLFWFAGVVIEGGNSNDSVAGMINFEDCGSGHATGSLTSTWSKPATFTITGDVTNNWKVVKNVSSTAGLEAGMRVTGTGIDVDTWIDSVDSATQITLHRQGTATNAGVTLTIDPSIRGGSRSTAQSSVINVPTTPPADLENWGATGLNQFVGLDFGIDGQVYEVLSIDRVNGKATIYPVLDTAVGSSGTVTWNFGGAFMPIGSDSNNTVIQKLRATRCGAGARINCLYGPTIIASQFTACGDGYILGARSSGACLGTLIGSAYFEGGNSSKRHVLAVGRYAGSNFHTLLADGGGYSLAKVWALGVARDLTTNLLVGDTIGGVLGSVRLPEKGKHHLYEKDNLTITPPSTFSFIIDGTHRHRTFRRDSQTVTLTPNGSGEYNRLFGYTRSTLAYLGTGNNGAPTSTITFTPATQTQIGTVTSGSAIVTGLNTASPIGLLAASPVSGADIASGTTIATVDSGTQITLSTPVKSTITYSLSTTGNLTPGSARITNIPSTTGMIAGQTISGTGIASGSTIFAVVDATNIDISEPVTVTLPTVGAVITASVSLLSTVSSGSAGVTVSTTAKLSAGMAVSNTPDVAPGTTILSVDTGTTMTLSATAAPVARSLSLALMGGTVNGLATQSYTGFGGEVEFDIGYTDTAQLVWTIAASAAWRLAATTSWTPGAIAQAACVQKDITVTGAVAGDAFVPSFTVDLKGCMITANCQAADSVRVVIGNLTGSSQTIGAGTVGVKKRN